MSILCARKQLFLYVQPWLFHSFALPLLLKIGIKHEGTDYQHQRTGRGRSGSLTATERRTQQQWTESQNVGSPQGDRRPDGRGNAREATPTHPFSVGTVVCLLASAFPARPSVRVGLGQCGYGHHHPADISRG